MNERIEKIKKHVKDYKTEYACAAGVVAGASFTFLLMRGVASHRISRDIVVAASRDIVVARENGVINNVSYISSNRQGGPSWVVRCLETGKIFTSQRAAASGMDLSAANISQHLNGVRDNVNGYTFERICMAA